MSTLDIPDTTVGPLPAPRWRVPRSATRSACVLAVVACTVWLGLWVTPPDEVQGNLARLLYIHPAVATVALYWAGGVACVGSLLYLWPRTRSFLWDRLAAASVEVGAVFSALTLVTGSLWGRPVWGVWWTWDARLTSTALLLILEIGYLALRRVPADPHIRARRCAVAALLVAIDMPLVHFSVDWWNTLHQGGTILDPGFQLHVHGSMLWTMLLSFVAFSLVFVWLLAVRYRIEVLEDAVGDQELEVSLAERWSEDTDVARAGGEGRREVQRELRRRRVRRRDRWHVRLRRQPGPARAAAGNGFCRVVRVGRSDRRAGRPDAAAVDGERS